MRRPVFNPTKKYEGFSDAIVRLAGFYLSGSTTEAVLYIRMATLSPWHSRTVNFQ